MSTNRDGREQQVVNAQSPREDGAFDRFRALAKNLMVVPKEEVDEQEREYRDKDTDRRRP